MSPISTAYSMLLVWVTGCQLLLADKKKKGHLWMLQQSRKYFPNAILSNYLRCWTSWWIITDAYHQSHTLSILKALSVAEVSELCKRRNQACRPKVPAPEVVPEGPVDGTKCYQLKIWKTQRRKNGRGNALARLLASWTPGRKEPLQVKWGPPETWWKSASPHKPLTICCWYLWRHIHDCHLRQWGSSTRNSQGCLLGLLGKGRKCINTRMNWWISFC